MVCKFQADYLSAVQAVYQLCTMSPLPLQPFLLVSLALQTELGCAQNMWRWTQEGYLREILTARVYDVAVSSITATDTRQLAAAGTAW